MYKRQVQVEIDAVNVARIQSRKQIIQLYDRLPKVTRDNQDKDDTKVTEAIRDDQDDLRSPSVPFLQKHSRSRFRVFVDSVRSFLRSLLIVSAGGMFIGKLEGWSWFDSLYYSLITGTSMKLVCSLHSLLRRLTRLQMKLLQHQLSAWATLRR